ncbi:MAG: TRCF domain-containing protein [Planctomycetota bacterium]
MGYEMYCRLLEAAVRSRRGLPVKEHRHCAVDLPAPASLPMEYISEARERIGVYQRFARAVSVEEVDAAVEDLRDRFGALPAEASVLADLGRVRVRSAESGADLIFQPEPDRVAIRALEPERLQRALAGLGDRVRRVDDRTFHVLVPDDVEGGALPRWLFEHLRPEVGASEGGKAPAQSARRRRSRP